MVTRVVVLVAAFLLGLAPTTVAQDLDQSASEIRLSTPRTGHTATLLDSGKVLLVGGSDGTAETTAVDVVDPGAGTITLSGRLLQARAEHSATRLADGRILIVGGRQEGASLDSAELWDPSTGTTQAAGTLRSARAGHEASRLLDGRVLVVGGEDRDGNPVARAEVYDPASGEFADSGKPKSPHIGAATTLLPDGRVLVTGTATKKNSPPAEVYVTGKGKWNSLKGTKKRTGHTSTLLSDGRILLAGGLVGKAAYGANQSYDPDGGGFSELPPLWTPRSEHTATLLPDGRVVILGGSDFGFEVAPIEVFDPMTGGFSVTGELETPRDGHTATLLPDGRILIVGGSFATLVLADVLLYDVATGTASPLGVSGAAVDVPALDPEAPQTRAEVRDRHGAPEAFAIQYAAGPPIDGSATVATLEEWSYYTAGVVYTLAGVEVISADRVELRPGVEVEPMPYDPDMFAPGMDLDAVVAAAGVIEYVGGPVGQMIEDGRVFFADRLAWGITGDELRYVEAFAFTAEVDRGEAVE